MKKKIFGVLLIVMIIITLIVAMVFKEKIIGKPYSFVKIVAGAEHFLALKADGSLWTWGDNHSVISTGTVRAPRRGAPYSGWESR